MSTALLKKVLPFGVGAVVLWLGARYFLPVAMPFLLGGGVALLAEPLVAPLSRRMNRPLSAGIGVLLTLGVLTGLLVLLAAIAVRQVGRLAAGVPDLTRTVEQSIQTAQGWVQQLSDRAPESLQPILTQVSSAMFSDGTVVLRQLTQQLPGVVSGAVGTIGDGVFGLGTGVVAAFLISARLPRLKEAVQKRLPPQWQEKFVPAMRRVRTALGGWFKAQLKLCGVTWGIVSLGFLLLRIPHPILWAGVVAVVDAVPILGTGTVLVPWAVISLLQGESLKAIGLLCTYGAALMTRTVLEPKTVGKQLGLDPLATLVTLYLGYRFWGVPGMLITPILASAIKSAFSR